ncbi:MAG: ATP-binding protein [Hyphomicrobium sp.]
MNHLTSGGSSPEARIAELTRQIQKLTKINNALLNRVERSMDQQANAFSLFQTAIGLEAQVRGRTETLKSVLSRLEIANDELVAARDTAERANRFKTRFFTAVGHDLLQPLHAARLSLSAMGEGPQPSQNQRLTVQVDHALSTIEDLLRSILDISKLEAGVMRPSIEVTPLQALFHTVAISIEPVVRDKGLALTVRPTTAMTSTDPLMLRRILQNLLANAVNYTRSGRLLLAARRRGQNLRIEVWDTGGGIEPSEQKVIFEEFQRGSQQEHTAGFGLGLAIVQRMSEALGHQVDVCSRLGAGTCFGVTVPFAGTALMTPPRDQRPLLANAYGFATNNVIVIENDSAVREAMHALLSRWGCSVRTAASLSETAALLQNEPEFVPSIVLADYHLDRGETGLSAVINLRAAFGAALPAIIITADYSDIVTGASYGARCEVLRKPVRPAELRALMQFLLR